MKTLAAALSVLVIAATLGCSDQQQPGPVEKAGKEVDQALEKAGAKTQSALEKAKDYTDEKMMKAGKAIEQAGEKLQK